MHDELMPSETALLMNLPDVDFHALKAILLDRNPHIRIIRVSSLAAVRDSLLSSIVVLMVIHGGSGGREAVRAVEKLRRSIGHRPPLLLLVPPERTGEIRTFLREGVDEFWILPMDSLAFPPRLEVLLEWGRSAQRPEGRHAAGLTLVEPNKAPFRSRVRESLRRVLLRGILRRGPASEPGFLLAGRWERVRRLGFGSFSEVLLVRLRGGVDLAVAKVPHAASMNAQFLREAAILRRLAAHPNSVKLLEVLEDGGKAVIVEEYVDGATLQELLDRGMDGPRKERAYLELLEFVAFAHGQRIMHRDIKPENIIVTPSGHTKLLDFGTAKDLSRKITSSTVTGSRPYMAPEQISGKSELPSDVWALGILLYTLATGLLPFYDDNEKRLMDMILESEPQSPRSLEPGLPEALEKVILTCLRKDPGLRYRDAGILKDELLRAIPQFGDGRTLPAD